MTWIDERRAQLPPDWADWAKRLSSAIHRRYTTMRWCLENRAAKRASEKAYRRRNKEFVNQFRAAAQRRRYWSKKEQHAKDPENILRADTHQAMADAQEGRAFQAGREGRRPAACAADVVPGGDD